MYCYQYKSETRLQTQQVKNEYDIYQAILCIVVSRESVESSKLMPSCAQLLASVEVEAADVRASQRYTKHVGMQHGCLEMASMRFVNYKCDLKNLAGIER